MVEVLLAIAHTKLTNLNFILEGQPPNDTVRRVKETIRDMTRHVLEPHGRNDGDDEFGTWEKKLKGVLYTLEDWVDEWDLSSLSTRGPCNSKCACLFGKHPRGQGKLLRLLSKTATELEGLHERMNGFNLEVRRSEVAGNTVMPTVVDIEVQKNEAEELKKLLLQEGRQLLMIYVWGEVGSGKSTVVSKACDQVKRRFDHFVWVRVYGSTSTSDILRSIWKACCHKSTIDKKQHSLGIQIFNYLKSQEGYLLVLDGMEENDLINSMREFLPADCGGRVVLISSRGRQEGSGSGIQIGPLSREDSLILFRAKASLHLPGTEIVEEIVTRCGGSPLALSIVGGLLSTKGEGVWINKVRGQLNSLQIQYDSIPVPADGFVLMGYLDLPPLVKACFLYTCLVFPEDLEISKREVIRMWLAEGLAAAEEAAERLFKQLIQRNMLEIARLGDTGDVEACSVLLPMRSFAINMISSTLNFCTILSSSSSNEDIRRVSITNGRIIGKQIVNRFLRLRSLLVWEANIHQLNMDKLCSRLKLLRVLIIQGISIKNIVSGDWLEGLLHLRYLGLRETDITGLPGSLERLQKLETIDVRDTKMASLPQCVSLGKVRHLLLAKSCSETAVVVPLGFLLSADSMQTLAGLKMKENWARDVGRLTKLRKFSVSEVGREHSDDLCTSINNMTLLRSLTIKCSRLHHQLHIQSLPAIPSLVKLGLGGAIVNDHLLERVSTFDSLVSLFLWDSNLTTDPLSTFRYLPNLVRLVLRAAYVGKEIDPMDEGFSKLKHLFISRFTQLEKWERIGPRAMRMLQTLTLGHCPNLRLPPQGLEDIGQGMLQVFVSDTHSDLNARLKEHHRLQLYTAHFVQESMNI